MKALLKNIADLHSGIYTKPGLTGDVYYIQARHFDRNGEFYKEVKPDLMLEGKIEKHLLKPGDILLAVKGYYNFAVHYKGIIEKAVASSMFIVIRLKEQNNILPEFLKWYLNHPMIQSLLQKQARGSNLPSLTIEAVKNLEIFIPSIQKQKLILKLNALRQKEKELNTKMESLRELLIQHQLIKTIK